MMRGIDVDAKGRALARGRRKASSARVWLMHGVGDVTVNRKPLGKYFNTAPQRAAVIAPLTALGTPGQWNVHATVGGGGAQLSSAQCMCSVFTATSNKCTCLPERCGVSEGAKKCHILLKHVNEQVSCEQ